MIRIGVNQLIFRLIQGASPSGGAELSNPTFALMSGASPTNGNLTADGFTWAQGGPMLVDNYGKFIAPIQWDVSGTKYNAFVVSNDAGATWSMPTHSGMTTSNGEQYLIRGAAAYDTTNDLVHVLWNAADVNDGLIYRRYSFTRDGSNNITAVAKVSGVSMVLDYQSAGSMNFQHPILFWMDEGTDGTLLAIWAARNASAGATKCEIRASMRVLSNTTDDATAGNWAAPISASTTVISQSPQVAYTALATKAAAATICHPSAGLKPNNDLYVLFSDGDNTEEWQYVKAAWDTTDWASVGSAVKICDFTRSGTDVGYTLKNELGTALHYDAAEDRLYFGIATWNGGDTWSFAYLDGSDTLSSIVDAYVADPDDCSANDFVTGDIMFDALTGRLVVAYTDLPSKHIYAALYDGTTQVQEPLLVFDDRPFDIPTLYPSVVDGKVLCIGRDFNDASTNNPPTYTPPYDGYFGTIELS